LKSVKPIFKDCDIAKQCFFLNIFNFLVLYQLAVLMLTNPDAVSKLTSYNMWQAFLVSASIKISYIKLTAFSIQHTILRHKLKTPIISAFMVKQQLIDCQELNEFKVVKPSKLICFGFYLPLQRIP